MYQIVLAPINAHFFLFKISNLKKPEQEKHLIFNSIKFHGISGQI
jgi:hypothetical protein